jgi:hypothetical protein
LVPSKKIISNSISWKLLLFCQVSGLSRSLTKFSLSICITTIHSGEIFMSTNISDVSSNWEQYETIESFSDFKNKMTMMGKVNSDLIVSESVRLLKNGFYQYICEESGSRGGRVEHKTVIRYRPDQKRWIMLDAEDICISTPWQTSYKQALELFNSLIR